jgi:uncharacterized protein involved in oxidation of intracellular sulfur
MKYAIIIYSNEPETVWNAFRLANTMLGYDNRVSVFLLGKGVEAIMVSTLKYDIQEQIEIYREHGGEMIGCGLCCESRKDEMPSLREGLQCEMGSMQQLYGLMAEADKVLTF